MESIGGEYQSHLCCEMPPTQAPATQEAQDAHTVVNTCSGDLDEDFVCILRGCAACASTERLEKCVERLDRHIVALGCLCDALYRENNTTLCDEACRSIQSFHSEGGERLQTHAMSLTCKRALLLLAMHMEPEVGAHFCKYGNHATKSGVLRLKKTVLPKTVQTFVTGLCQHPQTFCNQTLLLYELWDESPGYHDAFDDSNLSTDTQNDTLVDSTIELFPALTAVDASLQMNDHLLELIKKPTAQ